MEELKINQETFDVLNSLYDLFLTWKSEVKHKSKTKKENFLEEFDEFLTKDVNKEYEMTHKILILINSMNSSHTVKMNSLEEFTPKDIQF